MIPCHCTADYKTRYMQVYISQAEIHSGKDGFAVKDMSMSSGFYLDAICNCPLCVLCTVSFVICSVSFASVLYDPVLIERTIGGIELKKISKLLQNC